MASNNSTARCAEISARFVGACLALGLVPGSVAPARAGMFSVTDFAVHGAHNTAAVAINTAGVIAGNCANGPCGGKKAFVRTPDGTITIFAVQGPTIAADIADDGTIVGSYLTGSHSYAFVRAPDGSISKFSVPGALDTAPQRINTNDVILGDYILSGQHGFIRTPDGTLTTFDAPGAVSTYAADINASGTVIGLYWDANGAEHGFTRAPDGSFTTFDVPGAVAYYAMQINDGGEAAGAFYDGQNDHGFFMAPDGTVSQYDVAGATDTDIYALNSGGEIAGVCEVSGHLSLFYGTQAGQATLFNPGGVKASDVLGGLNDSGAIAGTIEHRSRDDQGFVFVP